MREKIELTRKYKDNNKEIKVNLVFNQISEETAEKFVTQVKNWYNDNIITNIKKVG